LYSPLDIRPLVKRQVPKWAKKEVILPMEQDNSHLYIQDGSEQAKTFPSEQVRPATVTLNQEKKSFTDKDRAILMSQITSNQRIHEGALFLDQNKRYCIREPEMPARQMVTLTSGCGLEVLINQEWIGWTRRSRCTGLPVVCEHCLQVQAFGADDSSPLGAAWISARWRAYSLGSNQ
jgi:hypothetical protein